MFKKFKFEEKQGRLCVRLDIYLKIDLDNEELKEVYDNLDIQVKHPLITGDYEAEPIME